MPVPVTDRYKEQSTRAGKVPPVVTEVYAFKQFAGIVVSGAGTTIRVAGDATSHFSSGDIVCVLSRGIDTELTLASAPVYSATDDWTSLVLGGFAYDSSEDLYNFVAVKFSLVPYLAETPIHRIRQSVEAQTLNVFDAGSFKIKLLNPDGDLYDEGTQDGFFYSTDRIWITVRFGFKGLTAANERPIIIGGIVDPAATSWKRGERSLSIQVYGYMKALDYMGAFETSNSYGPMTALTGVELVHYYPPLSGTEVYYGPKGLSFRFPDGESTSGVSIVAVADLDMRTGGRVFKYVHPNRYQWDYGPTVLVQDEDDVDDNGDKNMDDYAGRRAIFNFGRPASLAKNPNYHTQDIIWVVLKENGTRELIKGLPTLTFDNGQKAEAIPDFNAVVIHDSDANTWTDYTTEAAIPGVAFDLLGTNDTLYLGDNERFGGAYFDVQAPATGDFTIKIYYSKGPNNWIEIPEADPGLGIEGYVDGTEMFSVDGWITWQMPNDWRPTTVVDENDPGGDFGWQGLYFVKIETEADVPEYPTLVIRDTFGTTGSGDGNFDTPAGIWADEDYIYICDFANGRICIWTNDPPDGCTWVGSFSCQTGPRGITGDDTYLYVQASDSTGSVNQYLKASPYTLQKEINNLAALSGRHYGIGCSGSDAGDLYFWSNIYADPAGQLRIAQYEKDDTFVDYWVTTVDAGGVSQWENIEVPIDIDGDDKYVFVTANGGSITCLTKWDIDADGLVWDYGKGSWLGPGKGNEDPENEWVFGVNHVGRQHSPDRDGVLVLTCGVSGTEKQLVVVLEDEGDDWAYYDHYECASGLGPGVGLDGPCGVFWIGEFLYVSEYSADRVAVLGPATASTPVPGTCNRVQKVIGLVGKRGDQLNVLVDIPNLPSDSVDQAVVIKHDVDENNTVIPVPATWFQLASAHSLIKDLLRRGGYAPSIQHITELDLEVDTAQIFSYGGRCPHLTARHPISAMAYDSATGYLYVGSGLEIWRVRSHTEFERVCRIPQPGYTEPIEGTYFGDNYKTTWSNEYRIVALAFVTVSGHATVRGIAIHPHDNWNWSQYTCPAIAFEYDIEDGVFEHYTHELKDDDADSYYYGIWPGTHVVRPGRDVWFDGYQGHNYYRFIGQFDVDYVPAIYRYCGENISLPFGQLITCGRFQPSTGYPTYYTGMQAAAGLATAGTFFFGLWQFIGRGSWGYEGAMGVPWIYLPAGFYSHWDRRTDEWHDAPCRLRYTFGQEGFLDYDETEGRFHMAQAIRAESNAAGCYPMWRMKSYKVSDDSYIVEGLTFLRWQRHGTETQVMCGCMGTDGYRYIGVIQFVEMGSGEDSISATRIISYKEEGFFFTSSGAPGLQRPGKAYVYQSAVGWTDYSANLIEIGGVCPALATTGDYVYLGLTDQFLQIHISMIASYVDGTMELQIWTGSAWETMVKTGSSQNYSRYYDGTDNLAQDGDIAINPPWDEADKNRWAKSTFYGLSNPGDETEVPNTAEFYWIRIRMSSIVSGSAALDQIYASAIIVWDNWIHDGGGRKGYTILNLCDGDSASGNHIIHGCLWNRDEGTASGAADPLQYFYFVLDIDSSGITFTKSKTLTDATDTSSSQFKGHVYDSASDKVYSLLTHPLYRDRGAILIGASYSSGSITLERLDDLPAPDWGLSGKLLATGDGRIYGVTYPRGILFHYDITVYPRVTIADFGQGMSIRQAITHLCEITNTVFYISPDRQAYVQKRDHAVSAGDILSIAEPKHIVHIDEMGTWEHRYDGVHVNWSDIYDDSGTESAGSTGWEVRTLQISNPFVQDMYVAETMAQIYYDYFRISREVLAIRFVFMPWITLKDVLRLYISSRFANIDNTGRWSVSGLDMDLRSNRLDVKALTWDGDES